ncbi:cytochrome C oxidase subunit IV family protein [Aquimarina spinulae]|uniref:cytochrome C oxidase subunit IV family protein n=1 Tax=Aquimarina spinulae TaxID=1192023 RepID=UPI000D553284|nr:cytochrome C oxidase subunit IV family protein [Aquimarina spinulae]
MKKSITITYVFLILLTVISGIISGAINKNISFIILLLSALKFIGVSFYFMDLKKAHTFWKSIIIGYAIALVIIVLMI